jgi:hypothetical protein
MNTRALFAAVGFGLIAQIAMVIAGHYIPSIKNNVFAIGGMLISLAAGLAYARDAMRGWGDSLIGGLIVGGTCAFVGIAVSVLLQDTPASILAFGTAGSALAGLVGGAIGKLMT